MTDKQFDEATDLKREIKDLESYYARLEKALEWLKTPNTTGTLEVFKPATNTESSEIDDFALSPDILQDTMKAQLKLCANELCDKQRIFKRLLKQ